MPPTCGTILSASHPSARGAWHLGHRTPHLTQIIDWVDRSMANGGFNREDGGCSGPMPELQANAKRPDIAQLKGRLLADEFVFVPGLSLLRFHRNLQLGLRSCAKAL